MQVKGKSCDDLPKFFLNIMFWTDIAAMVYILLIVVLNLAEKDLVETEFLRSIAAFASFFVLIKIPLYWLRFFQSTEFHVLLVKEILADLKCFLLVLILILIATGVPMGILNVIDEKTGSWFLDSLFSQYRLMFRLVSNQTILFLEFEGPHAVLTFMAFFTMTILVHLVMLNILIAAAADAYNRIQENILVLSARNKLQLMSDHAYAF